MTDAPRTSSPAARGLGPLRFVVRRGVADRLVVGAAALVILAATTLLGGGVLYADAVTRAGLTASLGSGPIESRALLVSAGADPAVAAETDATVRRLVSATFGEVDVSVVGGARSESYALPGAAAGADLDLTSFASIDGLPERADLVAGAWPTAGGDALAIALSEPAAAALGVALDQELTVTSRLENDREVHVRVAGIYRVRDPGAVAWWADPLLLDGVDQGSFRTIGPLVVDAADLPRTIVHRIAQSWVVEPVLDDIQPADLGRLGSGIAGLQDALTDATGDGVTPPRVQTDLPATLGRAGAALLSSGSGIVVIVGQLSILAGYALVLIAGVLLEHRRADTALLRARGASTPRLIAYATLEALLLVIPAVLIAPWLAVALLMAIDPAAPFATTGVRLRPEVTPGIVALAAVIGAGCIAGLLLPVLASAGPIAAVRRTVGRQLRRTAAQRLGLDLALVAIAVIGLWQLTRYGAPVVRTLRGTLGLDPVLVVAPALGLLAGAVLALRTVPMLGSVLERALSARRGLVGSLAARQLARRPLHATRAILLLSFAAGIAVFAAGFAATWHRSQDDQVAFAVGTDVRFTRALLPTLDDWAVSGRLAAATGVQAAMPVVRESFDLGEGGRGTLVALPATAASGGVAFRTDLADRPLRDLLAGLPGEMAAGTTLPPQTARLQLDVLADLVTVKPDESWSVLPPGWPGIHAHAVIRDSTGLVSRLAAVPVPFGPEVTPMTVPLSVTASDDQLVRPAEPIELIGVELWVRMPENTAAAGRIELLGVTAEDDSGAGVPLGFRPSDTREGLLFAVPNSDPVPIADAQRDGTAIVISDQLPLAGPIFLDSPLTGNREVRFAYRPDGFGPSAVGPMPALATDTLLSALGVPAGDPIAVGERFADARRLVTAAALRGFPTIDPDRPAAIVDLGVLATSEYVATGRTLQPAEWWIDVDDASAESVAALATGPVIGGTDVRVRVRETQGRAGDPLAIGIVGALALGAAAAGLFAAIGLGIGAIVGIRQRGREIALLRALGLSSRQLVAALSAEHAFLLVVGSVTGIAIGIALAFVVLPAVTLSERATVAVPPVHVEVPVEVILLLLALAGAAFVGLVALQAGSLRRDLPAEALRATEDLA